MSTYITKAALESALNKQTDEITSLIRDFMFQVDTRFTAVEEGLSKLEESHHRLLNTLDKLVARIDRYETELVARDNQIEKLIAWAHKVSKKTGIPLEEL